MMQKLDAANIATNSSAITLLGLITLQPDIIIAGLCGGIVSILTIEELTNKQRLTSIVAALVTATIIGPWFAGLVPAVLVWLLPESLSKLLTNGGQETRMLVGFTIGFTAYKFLPALLSRGLTEIKSRRVP